MSPILIAHAAGGGGWEFPPVHPMFVNFTAALIPASFVFDLLAVWWKRDALRAAAWWTLLLAACLTPLTALFGWIWLASMGEAHGWKMEVHQWLGTSLAVLAIALAVWRGRAYARERGPGLAYALAAVVVLGGLMCQGDLGGAMSFGRGVVFRGGDRAEHGDAREQHGEPGHAATATRPSRDTSPSTD